MDKDRPVRAALHSYTRKSLDAAFKCNDAANTSGSKIPLPETPKPPSKKKSKMVDRVASENQTVSNLHLLDVLERVEKMQVQYLTRRAGLTIGHIPGGKFIFQNCCQGPSRRDHELLVAHWFVSCIDSVNHSITMRYRWGD